VIISRGLHCRGVSMLLFLIHVRVNFGFSFKGMAWVIRGRGLCIDQARTIIVDSATKLCAVLMFHGVMNLPNRLVRNHF
jgi:hypothetical protein